VEEETEVAAEAAEVVLTEEQTAEVVLAEEQIHLVAFLDAVTEVAGEAAAVYSAAAAVYLAAVTRRVVVANCVRRKRHCCFPVSTEKRRPAGAKGLHAAMIATPRAQGRAARRA